MAEQDALPDADLQLKKRARRRLVGAIALALFAIIVLPMVMDHEPRPPVQDIQVRIPSQDVTSVSGKPVAVKPPAPAVVNAAPVATEVKPEPVPAEKPEPKPEPKPAPKVEPKPAPKVEPKPAPVVAAPAAATAATAATAAAATIESAGQWVVQLGAYKDAGNVKILLGKLKEMRVPTYTEKFDTPQGARTRVRAGPFPSRDAAEKALAKIKTIRVDGTVAPK
jgi:DedD protein